MIFCFFKQFLTCMGVSVRVSVSVSVSVGVGVRASSEVATMKTMQHPYTEVWRLHLTLK